MLLFVPNLHLQVLWGCPLKPAKRCLQVSREECFQQGCQLAQAQGHLDGAPGACLIFPSFASPLSPGQVESESGQGPRREFFRLSGQGMLTHRPGALACA